MLDSRPCIIVANQRSGGTHLTHCLDVHPRIHCYRGEIFHPKEATHLYTKASNQELLNLFLHMRFYDVSAVKMIYSQFNWLWVRKLIREEKIPVIHLIRGLKNEHAFSMHVQSLVKAGKLNHPVHSYTETKVSPIYVNPTKFKELKNRLAKADKEIAEQIKELDTDTLTVYHEDLVAGEFNSVWKFLNVYPFEVFPAGLKKIHKGNLKDKISNWEEVL